MRTTSRSQALLSPGLHKLQLETIVVINDRAHRDDPSVSGNNVLRSPVLHLSSQGEIFYWLLHRRTRFFWLLRTDQVAVAYLLLAD